jgi:hypothetical protein
MRVLEHIGEVTKLLINLYCYLTAPHQDLRPPSVPSSGSSTCSSTHYSTFLLSLGMQSHPHISQITQGLCIPTTDAVPPHLPIGLSITSTPSDVSEMASTAEILPTIAPYHRFNASTTTQQEHCSTLARHLSAHVENL